MGIAYLEPKFNWHVLPLRERLRTVRGDIVDILLRGSAHNFDACEDRNFLLDIFAALSR